MRLLVLSDSHHDRFTVQKIVTRHSDIHHVVFLGDVVDDLQGVRDDYPNKNWHIVSGNCDGQLPSGYPATLLFEIEGRRILATHGHRFHVKYGTDELADLARANGCTLALYGHTHVAHTTYENGLYLVNPGSLSHPREGDPSYAIVDVMPGGVVTSLLCPRSST